MKIVYPSGRDFAVNSPATTPFALARLSTITCCLKTSVSFAPVIRARISVVPPGCAGVMKRIGRSGYSPANIAPAAKSAVAPKIKRNAGILICKASCLRYARSLAAVVRESGSEGCAKVAETTSGKATDPIPAGLHLTPPSQATMEAKEQRDAYPSHSTRSGHALLGGRLHRSLARAGH